MPATASQLNIKAPAGGFKDLGWYPSATGGSYQFHDGTFGDNGSIHPGSPQQGAGQKVSAEVNRQSSVAAGMTPNAIQDYLYPATPVGPNSADQVTPFLNDFQNGLFNAGNSPETRVQTLGEIGADLGKSGLLPDPSKAPVAPNMAETFKNLSDAKGVDAIQAGITDLKAQQDAIASQLQVTKTAERGKPVAQNVIEGRVSTEQQQAQDQYDFIGRQLARKQDELTSTLGNIQMIMQFTQTDYTNASNSYNTQFDQAITTFNLMRGIQQDQKTDAQRAQDNARANLQIMVNAVTSGNLSLGGLGPDQQAQLNKLEVQSGLPIGFMQSLHMSAKDRIISTSSDNGVISVLSMGADGQPVLQKYGTPTGPGVITANTNALKADVAAKMTLDAVMKKYGNSMSPDTILSTYNSFSPFGTAKESLATLQKKYNVTPAKTTTGLSSQDQTNIKKIKDDISNGDYTRADAVSTFPEYAQYL